MALDCAYPGAPESDFLDGTGVVAYLDKVVHVKWAVGENRDRAEEIPYCVFGGQCDSETAYAGTEQEGFDVGSEDALADKENGYDCNCYSQRLANHWHEHVVELGFGLADEAIQVIFDDFNEPVKCVCGCDGAYYAG